MLTPYVEESYLISVLLQLYTGAIVTEYEKLLKDYAVAVEEHKKAEIKSHTAYLAMKEVASQAEKEWSACVRDENDKFSKVYAIQESLLKVGKSLT